MVKVKNSKQNKIQQIINNLNRHYIVIYIYILIYETYDNVSATSLESFNNFRMGLAPFLYYIRRLINLAWNQAQIGILTFTFSLGN